MRYLWGCALVLVAVIGVGGASLRGQAPTPTPAAGFQPPVVPVYREPHHRQVYQYGPTRILDLQIPPGDISWFHSHESPVLYVTLGTSQTRTQNLGEDWGGGGNRAAGAGRAGETPPAAAGGRQGAAGGRAAGPPRATSTTSYFEKPITHRLENIGTGLFRAMVVVNETAGDEAATEQAAGFDAKPELTNRWFRAYRIVLGPGETTPSHVHKAPVAVFQATAGKATGKGATNWDFNDPGQWAFFDAGDRHEIHNAGDGRLELIEVEVRRK